MNRTATVVRQRIIGLIAICAGAASGCSDSYKPVSGDRGTLTIYSSLPLQGDAQPQSEDIVRALEMALDDTNGEAAGYEIRYVSLDDSSALLGAPDPELIETNARRAAADPSTIAYIGEFNSSATVVSLPILNEAGILQVSPSNTLVGLTRSNGAPTGEPGIFYPTGERTFGRVVPADHVQAGAVVSYLQVQNCSNVFIISDGEPFYGQAIASQVERYAEDQGLEALDNTAIDLTAKNFARLGHDMRVAGADCMFFGGRTQNRAVDLTLDVAATNPAIRMFFPDGCAELAFTEHVPADIESRVFITNPTLDPAGYPEMGQAFFENFRAEHGTDPEPYAIYGYEAMSVVLDAIERASDDAAPTAEGRQAVIAAFFNTRDRQSVLGTYDIDPYGDTTLTSYGGYVVEDGRVVYHQRIQVEVAEPVVGPELTDRQH